MTDETQSEGREGWVIPACAENLRFYLAYRGFPDSPVDGGGGLREIHPEADSFSSASSAKIGLYSEYGEFVVDLKLDDSFSISYIRQVAKLRGVLEEARVPYRDQSKLDGFAEGLVELADMLRGRKGKND